MLQVKWFKIVFFAILACDSYYGQTRAIHYDHEFYASHFDSFYDLLPSVMIPGRLMIVITSHIICVSSIMCMLNILYKPNLAIIWVLYCYTFFSSRLDSYQHHYFLCLVLTTLLFCDRYCFYVKEQVGWLYMLTCVTKAFDRLFLSGELLRRNISEKWVFDSIYTVHAFTSITEEELWKLISLCVILTELYLGNVWHGETKQDKYFAIFLGVTFHIGVELIGFHVLYFSYYMIAMYILLLPDGVIKKVDDYASPIVNALYS